MDDKPRERSGKSNADWGEIEGIRPPVITIKKDAVIDAETDLHYSREKRLALPSALRRTKPIGGFWRGLFGLGRRGGGRSGGRFGALLPVFIIAVAAVFIIRFTGRSQGPDTIAGYTAALRAEAFEGSLLVSVTFTPPGRGASGSPGQATVRFLLPDTGEELIVSGSLPADSPVIRGRMHYTGREKTIKAEVRIGGQVKTLTARIRLPLG